MCIKKEVYKRNLPVFNPISEIFSSSETFDKGYDFCFLSSSAVNKDNIGRSV